MAQCSGVSPACARARAPLARRGARQIALGLECASSGLALAAWRSRCQLRGRAHTGSAARTLLLAFTLAPFCMRNLAPSTQPSYAQLCRAVLPACSARERHPFSGRRRQWQWLRGAARAASTSFTLSPAARAAASASRSRALAARCSRMGPTVPRPAMQPPPSALTPTGPYVSGNGPLTFFHHGFFSTIAAGCGRLSADGWRWWRRGAARIVARVGAGVNLDAT